MKRKSIFLSILVILLAVLLAACGGPGRQADQADTGYPAELVAEGRSMYNQTCFACHGPDAKGLPGLGVDLTTSEFFRGHSDQEILAYVLEGRPVDHPENITGVAMPPKGGFDFLTDEQILAVIAYLRTLAQ